MLISKDAMRKRYESAKKIMKDNNLEAIFVIGDRMPGDEMTGDFQYFVGNYIWYRRHCVLMFPDHEPVLLSGAWISTQKAKQCCWIEDCRAVSSDLNFFENIANVLAEKGVKSGRVGVNLLYMSVVAEKVIHEKIPGIEFAEIHPEIMKLRYNPGIEERALIKKSAELADGAYEYIRQFIKPGVTQNKIRAELENYMIGEGAEECFTGVTSGRYSTTADKNKLGFSYPPLADMKKVEPGDAVWLEITPRYDGYWSQLVRYVQVSEPNPELEEVHALIRKTLDLAVKGVQPGKTIGSMVRELREKFPSISSDYTIGWNVGHICGLDLTDGNLLDESEVIMAPGMALIIHPSLIKLDGTCELFTGETYMVTETGCERLMKSDDKIYVV